MAKGDCVRCTHCAVCKHRSSNEQPWVEEHCKLAARDERPHGEWIIIDDCEKFIARCSVCGRILDSRMVKDYPFCRCGADMREGEASDKTSDNR